MPIKTALRAWRLRENPPFVPTHPNYRWKIFAVLSLMHILGYFYRVSMAVISKDVQSSLSLSQAQLGILSGVLFYAFAFSQLPLGPILDRWGGRKVIGTAGFVSATGAALFAFAPGYESALIARLLLGVGTSCVLMGAYKIFTRWFTAGEFAVVAGCMLAAGNLGNLGATAPLAFLLPIMGWRGVFAAISVIQAVLAIMVYHIVHDAPTRDELPAGLKPFSAKDHLAETLRGWKSVLSIPGFWLLCFVGFCWYACYMLLQGLWGGPYLMDVFSFDRATAGKYLAAIPIGYIIGSAFIGYVSNAVLKSRKLTLILGQVVVVGSLAMVIYFNHHLPSILLLSLLFVFGLGVSSGGILYTMAKEMNPSHSATAMTLANFAIIMGGAVIQQVVGHYLHAHGQTLHDYHHIFMLPLFGVLVASGLFLTVSDTRPVEAASASEDDQADELQADLEKCS